MARRILLSAAIIVGLALIAALWGMQHQMRMQLRDESDASRKLFAQLARLEMENMRLSNIVVQANTPLAEAQLAELKKLRAQVELLRKQTNGVATLRREISRLRAALANARNSVADD